MWHKRLIPVAAIAPIVLIVLCVLAVRLFSGGAGGQQLIFNKIDAVYDGAPRWNPDAYSEELAAEELNDLLGIDIAACIPDSLKEDWVFSSADYIKAGELGAVDIGILDPANEPYFGKAIVLSVANKTWSDQSNVLIDYSYGNTTYQRSVIHGVSVDAYVRTDYIWENKNTGFRKQKSTVYIAQFTIGGFDYYVEGREGIKEAEFSEFVSRIIESYQK